MKSPSLVNLVVAKIERTPLPFTENDVNDIVSLIREHDSFRYHDEEALKLWVRQRLLITNKIEPDE